MNLPKSVSAFYVTYANAYCTFCHAHLDWYATYCFCDQARAFAKRHQPLQKTYRPPVSKRTRARAQKALTKFLAGTYRRRYYPQIAGIPFVTRTDKPNGEPDE